MPDYQNKIWICYFFGKKSGLNKDKVAKSKVGDFCRASGKHHHCFCKEPSYGNNDFP